MAGRRRNLGAPILPRIGWNQRPVKVGLSAEKKKQKEAGREMLLTPSCVSFAYKLNTSAAIPAKAIDRR